MRVKHPIAQALLIVVAAMTVAVIANGFAADTRRLVLPGWYPNATKVPQRQVTTPAPPVERRAPSPAVAQTTETTSAATTSAAEAAAAPQVTATTTISAATTTTPPLRNPETPQPQPTPTTSQPDNPITRFTAHPDRPYIEISGDDAVALHKSGALVLDARRSSIYEEGHIPGARSYSVWEADVDDKVMKLYEERSDPAEQNKPIVIYCSGGACEDSHMLAQKLWAVQFNNVYVYKDGFPDWQKRGLAVHKGATP